MRKKVCKSLAVVFLTSLYITSSNANDNILGDGSLPLLLNGMADGAGSEELELAISDLEEVRRNEIESNLCERNRSYLYAKVDGYFLVNREKVPAQYICYDAESTKLELYGRRGRIVYYLKGTFFRHNNRSSKISGNLKISNGLHAGRYRVRLTESRSNLR